MDERRTQRVAEALREELAEIIGFETGDPRFLAATVGEVHVSPDGRHARVRVGVRGSDREQKETLTALDHARHYLRHELAGHLGLRHVPELYFELDRFEHSGERVEILLKRAKKSRGRDENHP